MEIDFQKMDGLVPAIVQDSRTGAVLMLGFMNKEALFETKKSGKVTFFSRSKNRLWTKGETSGNFLIVKEVLVDCDKDTLLIKADPMGVVCHTGRETCFEDTKKIGFLGDLEFLIAQREKTGDINSYTKSLFEKGINRIAQKVGEEAVELVIASKDDDQDKFLDEAADLVFHLLVLLRARNASLGDVVSRLVERSV